MVATSVLLSPHLSRSNQGRKAGLAWPDGSRSEPTGRSVSEDATFDRNSCQAGSWIRGGPFFQGHPPALSLQKRRDKDGAPASEGMVGKSLTRWHSPRELFTMSPDGPRDCGRLPAGDPAHRRTAVPAAGVRRYFHERRCGCPQVEQ